jgi:hypothetical protein
VCRFRRWLAHGAVVAAALAAVATACGGGTNAAKNSNPSTISTSAGTDSFCSDYVAMWQAFSRAPWNGEPTTYPPAGVMKHYYGSVVKPLVEKFAGDTAPDAIRADVATQVDIARRFGATGNLAIIDDPAFFESGDRIDVYAYENCSFHTTDVIGVDFAYRDLASELHAGANAFKFMNQATSGELHELLVLRKNDGVTQSFDELLGLPDDELFEKATLIGKGVAFMDERTYLFADLEPGGYLAVCSIPQGTIGHTFGHGPPHFTLGMRQEFTVK